MNYFNEDEFNCPCCGKNEMKQDFLFKIDDAREVAQVPFKVNSGFRCSKHNEEVGGSTTSSHLLGWAADISAVSSNEKFKIVAGLLDAGFTRIGVGKNFIHADCDPNKVKEVIWTY